MGQKLVTHENAGQKKQFKGREVNWLQRPETSGGEYSSVCMVMYEPGARSKPAHSHPYGEETVYVISGEGKVKIGDEIWDIKPGSLLLFPKDIPHMIWNCGADPLKLCCFYAPIKEAIEYAWHKDFDFPEFQQTASKVNG